MVGRWLIVEFLLGCQAHPFSFSPFQVEFSVACLTPSDVLRRGFRGVLEDYVLCMVILFSFILSWNNW